MLGKCCRKDQWIEALPLNFASDQLATCTSRQLSLSLVMPSLNRPPWCPEGIHAELREGEINEHPLAYLRTYLVGELAVALPKGKANKLI